MDILLRNIKLDDLDDFFKLNHPDMAHHNFDGPYFAKETLEELQQRVDAIKANLISGKSDTFVDKRHAIADANTDKLVGMVNWYWKSEETNWLEVGVVVFDDNYWGRGIASKALKKWIDIIFEQHPKIVRIGLTTWSGNIGMVKVAEKLGLAQEACFKNARIVDGKYYDSVSYGILRQDWNF